MCHLKERQPWNSQCTLLHHTDLTPPHHMDARSKALLQDLGLSRCIKLLEKENIGWDCLCRISRCHLANVVKVGPTVKIHAQLHPEESSHSPEQQPEGNITILPGPGIADQACPSAASRHRAVTQLRESRATGSDVARITEGLCVGGAKGPAWSATVSQPRGAL